MQHIIEIMIIGALFIGSLTFIIRKYNEAIRVIRSFYWC